MFLIIVGAIVNLLVFFFERWWAGTHPINPTAGKGFFLTEVARPKYFWMGSKRLARAGVLFDKFVERYENQPPVFKTSDAPLSASEARGLAAKYALGLTMTKEEDV